MTPSARPARRARRLLLLLPLALSAGCGLVEPDRARVTVRYREVAPLHHAGLVVNVRDGLDEWYLEGTDLEPDGGGWLVGRTLHVRADGQVEVAATVRVGSDVVTAGSITLPLDEAADWRVDVFPSDRPQWEACGGCDGVQRFAIAAAARPSAQDWLYVTWTDRADESTSATRE